AVATAEADYLIAAATNDDNSAHSWAQSDGSAAAAFEAAYADGDLAWLNGTAATYVTDRTNDAQADADYADQAASLDASLTSQTTQQDGALAVTQAQLYQAEEDAIAGEEQTFALAQTSEYGSDVAGRTGALAQRSLASGENGADADVAQAENFKTRYIDVATGLVYVPPEYDNSTAVAEANANYTWVDQTTKADSNEQTNVATDDQTRGDDEANTELSSAQHSADAQWEHDETVASEQEANAATLAGDEQTRDETYATDAAALQTAEYSNAASVMSSLAGTVDTPWTQYLAGFAGAASSWWASNVSAYVGYQNTLAGDQEAESIAVAKAVQTQANAQADADHTLAYDTAKAAHDQAIDDDAAQQAEQAGDATNNRNYQLGMAQAAVDYENLMPDITAANNAQKSDTTTADQSYLSAEQSAQDTLTTATAGDALTYSIKVAQAQLNWSKAGDATTEGYLYSTSLA
ncbi:MAG: hypothetical protein ACREES_08695, partial [Stellaceae bacterium]